MATRFIPSGRLTDYTPDLGAEIIQRTMLGEWAATNKQIAAYCGVEPETIRQWRKKYRDFDASIRRAKLLADNRVEGAMFHRACAGDVAAQSMWLKNRRPDEWREKRDIDIRTPDGIQVNHSVADVDRLVNLPQEEKIELARSARAHHAVLVRLNLMAASEDEEEPPE